MARFVLVHGGFSGGWIWLPLMDRLKADGHVVEAFDLPGMGPAVSPQVLPLPNMRSMQ